jgi:hypothetical protein
MGLRPSNRITAGEILYDDFEPFKEIKSELLSVFVAADSSRLDLNLTSGGLTFSARADDDTLIWHSGQRESAGPEITHTKPWSDSIGKQFQFAWLMMNEQGYISGALLGFDSLLPQIALNAVASVIKVSSCGLWSDAAKT